MAGKKEIKILNLLLDLSESLVKYFEKSEISLFERSEVEDFASLDYILVGSTEEAKEACKDFDTDKNDIRIITIGSVKAVKPYLLANGRLFIDKEFSSSELGEFILNKFFFKNYNIHLDESFSSSFSETKEFKITNHLSSGLNIDQISLDAFEAGFNIVSLRSFIDHCVYYFTYLKQAGLAGIPYEFEYASNEDFFVVNVHASVRNFVAEYMIDAFGDVTSDDPLNYLLSIVQKSSNFLDVTYLENPGKIVFTAFWSKSKSNLKGLAFNNIQTTAQSLAQLEKKIKEYVPEEEVLNAIENKQGELEGKPLPGGIQELLKDPPADSALAKEPEKAKEIVAFVAEVFEKENPDKEISEITQDEMEEILEQHPDKEFVEDLKEEDLEILQERTQKKELIEAFENEKERMEEVLEKDEKIKEELQETLNTEVAKKVAENVSLDAINKILGSKKPDEEIDMSMDKKDLGEQTLDTSMGKNAGEENVLPAQQFAQAVEPDKTLTPEQQKEIQQAIAGEEPLTPEQQKQVLDAVDQGEPLSEEQQELIKKAIMGQELTPEKQQQIVEAIAKGEALSPEQKAQVADALSKPEALSPEQQQQITEAVTSEPLTPEQQEQIITAVEEGRPLSPEQQELVKSAIVEQELTPEQQEKIVDAVASGENLTPEQQQQVAQAVATTPQTPPLTQEQKEVVTAIEAGEQLSPEQQEIAKEITAQKQPEIVQAIEASAEKPIPEKVQEQIVQALDKTSIPEEQKQEIVAAMVAGEPLTPEQQDQVEIAVATIPQPANSIEPTAGLDPLQMPQPGDAELGVIDPINPNIPDMAIPEPHIAAQDIPAPNIPMPDINIDPAAQAIPGAPQVGDIPQNIAGGIPTPGEPDINIAGGTEDFDEDINVAGGFEGSPEEENVIGAMPKQGDPVVKVGGDSDDPDDDGTLVKGGKEGADNFSASISGMGDDDKKGLFNAISSGFEDKNGMPINFHNSSSAEQDKQVNKMVMNSLKNPSLDGMDLSVKGFVQKEAPAKIKKGLEDFAAAKGLDISKLSNEQIAEFQMNVMPSLMNELVEDTQAINQFKSDLENASDIAPKTVFNDNKQVVPESLVVSKIKEDQVEFESNFKTKLENNLAEFDGVEKTADGIVVSDNAISPEQMNHVIQETMKETFAEEFNVKGASKEEIAKKEEKLVSNLSKTLDMPKEAVSEIVKEAAQKVKEKENQLVAEKVFNESQDPTIVKERGGNDSNGAAGSNIMEATLMAKVKKLEEENKALHGNISAMDVKLKASQATNSKIEEANKASKPTEEEIQNHKGGEIDIPPAEISDEEKNRLLADLKAGKQLSPEDAAKIERAMDRENKLATLSKQAEVEIKKAQLEISKKDAFFKSEMDKAEKTMKAKELVLEKAKESMKNLVGKKEAEIAGLRTQVTSLNQKLESDQSTQLIAQVKALSNEKEALERSSEVYKNKLETMAKEIEKSKKADNSAQLAEEVRALKRIKNQLENKANADTKTVRSFEERYKTAKTLETKFRTELTQAQGQLRAAEGQVKQFKDAQVRLNKKLAQQKSVGDEKMAKELQHQKNEVQKLRKKLMDVSQEKANESMGSKVDIEKALQAAEAKSKQIVEASQKEVAKVKEQEKVLQEKIAKLEASLEAETKKTLGGDDEKTKELEAKVQNLAAMLKEEKDKAAEASQPSSAKEKQLEQRAKTAAAELSKAKTELAEQKKAAQKTKTEITGLKNKLAAAAKEIDKLKKGAAGKKKKKAA